MKHGIKITVSQTVETITEYIHGEDGLPLVFNSVNEALRYFHERNFILAELLYFDFNIEEANKTICTLG
jgi:hypothetical protein